MEILIMIKHYRKKPVVIEAVVFDGNNYKECKNFIYVGKFQGE